MFNYPATKEQEKWSTDGWKVKSAIAEVYNTCPKDKNKAFILILFIN